MIYATRCILSYLQPKTKQIRNFLHKAGDALSRRDLSAPHSEGITHRSTLSKRVKRSIDHHTHRIALKLKLNLRRGSPLPSYTSDIQLDPLTRNGLHNLVTSNTSASKNVLRPSSVHPMLQQLLQRDDRVRAQGMASLPSCARDRRDMSFDAGGSVSGR